jgi:hypothetical protein
LFANFQTPARFFENFEKILKWRDHLHSQISICKYLIPLKMLQLAPKINKQYFQQKDMSKNNHNLFEAGQVFMYSFIFDLTF